MAKKDKKSKEAKKARTAEKQKKNQTKAESKSKKQAKKNGEEEEDEDIDQILEQFAKEQEELQAVHVEVCGRPSKRLNPTLVANPTHNKGELVLFGGESTVNGVSHFYNDLYTYTIDNDTWRKITSKNSPLPRSSHAMCAHPSGIMLMFGGEFSSPKQSTFYHYGDTWVLEGDTKEWTKVDHKRGPSARSGHRMTVWKNYIILHGGFKDLGTSTTYFDDMWLFDITTYKWTQVEFPPNHPIPDARSGHSLIPCADGAIIWGGYCKVKAKKGLQKGKVLQDCWMLKMKADPKAIRFERRRKQGFNPSARVGCSMVHHKNRGILFGGVYDYEESEEQIESQFYNNLYAYQIEANRWFELSLKPQRKKKQETVKEKSRDEDLEDILNSILAKANLKDDDDEEVPQTELLRKLEEEEERHDKAPEFPVVNKLPHERFNAVTCVVDDVLYIFGGTFERGEVEYSLDSFYAIDLGRLDGVKVYWEDHSDLEKEIVDSEDEDDDEDDDDEDEDEEEKEEEELEEEEAEEEEEEEEDEFPDPRPWLPHPKPFESLRAFYIRTGAQFLEWSISSNRDARGKYLKKAAFDLCEERFWERREQVSIAEDDLEEMGGVAEVIDRETKTKRR